MSHVSLGTMSVRRRSTSTLLDRQHMARFVQIAHSDPTELRKQRVKRKKLPTSGVAKAIAAWRLCRLNWLWQCLRCIEEFASSEQVQVKTFLLNSTEQNRHASQQCASPWLRQTFTQHSRTCKCCFSRSFQSLALVLIEATAIVFNFLVMCVINVKAAEGQLHRPSRGLNATTPHGYRRVQLNPTGGFTWPIRLTSTLSMRLPSRSTTSNRQPEHGTCSPVFSKRPDTVCSRPATVL